MASEPTLEERASTAKESLRKHILLVDANGSKRTRGEKEIALLIADHDRLEALASSLKAERDGLLEALGAIADESVFNQQRFAEDDDADYFLRCFNAVKQRARQALAAVDAAQKPGERDA